MAATRKLEEPQQHVAAAHEEDQPVCCICFEPLEEHSVRRDEARQAADIAAITDMAAKEVGVVDCPASHRFHYLCMMAWCKQKPLCPLDRCQIRTFRILGIRRRRVRLEALDGKNMCVTCGKKAQRAQSCLLCTSKFHQDCASHVEKVCKNCCPPQIIPFHQQPRSSLRAQFSRRDVLSTDDEHLVKATKQNLPPQPKRFKRTVSMKHQDFHSDQELEAARQLVLKLRQPGSCATARNSGISWHNRQLDKERLSNIVKNTKCSKCNTLRIGSDCMTCKQAEVARRLKQASQQRHKPAPTASLSLGRMHAEAVSQLLSSISSHTKTS